MQQEGQVMASDLIGQNVVGPNGESIGEINDIIVDQSGRTVGAIIGVGGFLGIGEKDVAVAFDSLEMSRDTDTTASTTTAPGAAGTAGTAGGTAANQTGVAATPTAGKPVVATDGRGEVERVVLNMTKDQLKAAPTFRRMDDRDTSNASAPATTAPGSTAPGAPARPATPN
jgi:sporulation protein YlmC with PRC-barrel domain